MDFAKRKAAALAAINSPEPDKSPKGSVDTPIISLLTTLNSHPSYFTTSSCSGRISIFSQPTSPTLTASKKKAKGGTWLFISHDPVDPTTVLPLLFTSSLPLTIELTQKFDYVFRFEPLIISVECRDLEAAQFLVSLAISCGFRESGITSASKRVIVAIRCSIRLEVPLGDSQKIMVSPEYINFLIGVANAKMETNRKRTDAFLDSLLKNSFSRSVKSVEKMMLNGEVVSDELLESRDLPKSESLKIASNTSDEYVDRERRSTSDSQRGKFRTDCMLILELSDQQDDQSRSLSYWKEFSIFVRMNRVHLINLESYRNKNIFDSFRVAFLKFEHSLNISILTGSSHVKGIKLSLSPMVVAGEPAEKLFLWGHSACTLGDTNDKKVLIFGGFGGIGRHARRNDTFLLDPKGCTIEDLNLQTAPSPCLGHTATVVGDSMYVIGGRGGPLNILNDVWAFRSIQREWLLLQCSGSSFPSRHRHAAAAIDSKIYVFGGIQGEEMTSSLYVFNTQNLAWSEICIQGEWPPPRHSHSMQALGSELYMFGGYDGEKALADLYTFNVKICEWKMLEVVGRGPTPRFSHSMFIYNNYLGVIGGCPISQQYPEISLLDLQSLSWKHIVVHSIGIELFVRSTASVIGDDLILVGGGASCYAFGTKFSEPVKIDLVPLMSLADVFPGKTVETQIPSRNSCSIGYKSDSDRCCHDHLKQISHGNSQVDQSFDVNAASLTTSHQVLRFERKYAKLGKDILKKFGWLDRGRKVWVKDDHDGMWICFPVKENFCTLYDKLINFGTAQSVCVKGILMKNISESAALDILMACGATKLADEVAEVRKTPISPLQAMKEAVSLLIENRGLSTCLLEQLPSRWERLGDIVVLPVSSFKDPAWDTIGGELWPVVAKSLGARRLARQGRIAPSGTRDSTLEIVVGDSGWVEHRENGILYSFDATKCMFSWGNLSEKLRMAHLDCRNEVVVDLFSGIGYFTLPFLVRAHAKLVYACEWNPWAVEALRRNLHANSVSDRCVILEGDNKITCPRGVADRVCLGLLPTSEESWVMAVRALRSDGGTLHVHSNVKDSEESSWADYVARSIHNIAISEGYQWQISVEHVERVKWYAPHVRHLVADVRCCKV